MYKLAMSCFSSKTNRRAWVIYSRAILKHYSKSELFVLEWTIWISFISRCVSNIFVSRFHSQCESDEMATWEKRATFFCCKWMFWYWLDYAPIEEYLLWTATIERLTWHILCWCPTKFSTPVMSEKRLVMQSSRVTFSSGIKRENFW